MKVNLVKERIGQGCICMRVQKINILQEKIYLYFQFFCIFCMIVQKSGWLLVLSENRWALNLFLHPPWVCFQRLSLHYLAKLFHTKLRLQIFFACHPKIIFFVDSTSFAIKDMVTTTTIMVISWSSRPSRDLNSNQFGSLHPAHPTLSHITGLKSESWLYLSLCLYLLPSQITSTNQLNLSNKTNCQWSHLPRWLNLAKW